MIQCEKALNTDLSLNLPLLLQYSPTHKYHKNCSLASYFKHWVSRVAYFPACTDVKLLM